MDRSSFIEVVTNNRKLIYKICNMYCKNEEGKKDLQQEILIQLWLSFKKFDGRVKISTWIYRIALNTAISFYRKDKKNKEYHTNLDYQIITLADDGDSEKNEEVEKLYSFIEKLKELDKALMLLYLEGQKYIEIAEVMGISESNVATKINRIKKSLKRNFTKN